MVQPDDSLTLPGLLYTDSSFATVPIPHLVQAMLLSSLPGGCQLRLGISDSRQVFY